MNAAQSTTPSPPSGARSVARCRSTSSVTRSVRSIGVPTGSSSWAVIIARSVGGKNSFGTRPNPAIAVAKTSPVRPNVIHRWRSIHTSTAR